MVGEVRRHLAQEVEFRSGAHAEHVREREEQPSDSDGGVCADLCVFSGGGVFRLQFCVQTGISCEMSGLGVADLK